MRIVAAVFCVLMILFAAVQYNDPDVIFWGSIYGLAAVFCGIAAFAPGLLGGRGAQMVLAATLVLAVAGVWWFWPDVPGWWRKAVWMEAETAREGMGMMIAAAAFAIAMLVSLQRRA